MAMEKERIQIHVREHLESKVFLQMYIENEN
jgi:hypothetical protein